MSDAFWVMAMKPFLLSATIFFLYCVRKVFNRIFPDGRLKNLLNKELWLTDWERAARDRRQAINQPIKDIN